MQDVEFAREVWRRLESLHAVIYFAPEPREHAETIGLRAFWRTYFAYRAAPLGMCSTGTVTAAFFGFAPAMVAKAIPSIWDLAQPPTILDARAASASAALHRLLPDELEGLLADDWALGVLADAAQRGTTGGLPLYLANRDLPLADDPAAVLWQLTTTLREHRGDGHVANWTARGFAPGEVAVLFVAAGGTTRESLQPNRGWSDDEWAAAVDRNAARGLLGVDGAITDGGSQVVAEVEHATDRLAAAPFSFLGDDERRRLLDALTPAAIAITRSAVVPAVNPMGVPLLDDQPPR